MLIQEDKIVLSWILVKNCYTVLQKLCYTCVSGRKCHCNSPWDIIIHSRGLGHFCISFIFFPTKQLLTSIPYAVALSNSTRNHTALGFPHLGSDSSMQSSLKPAEWLSRDQSGKLVRLGGEEWGWRGTWTGLMIHVTHGSHSWVLQTWQIFG